MLFLRRALEFNLSLVFNELGPKTGRSTSRKRCEGYKKAKTPREARKLRASREDLVWDYSHSWIDFSAEAPSNAVPNEIIMDDYLRAINDFPSAYTN